MLTDLARIASALPSDVTPPHAVGRGDDAVLVDSAVLATFELVAIVVAAERFVATGTLHELLLG